MADAAACVPYRLLKLQVNSAQARHTQTHSSTHNVHICVGANVCVRVRGHNATT